jgi:hypothetical protein
MNNVLLHYYISPKYIVQCEIVLKLTLIKYILWDYFQQYLVTQVP